MNPSNDDEDDDEPMGMADALLQRGAYRRQLRTLEQADEAERKQQEEQQGLNEQADTCIVVTLPNQQQKTVLQYDSYLHHQRYYDDLKHADYDYVDYGTNIGGVGSSRLVVQQNKALGKGGLCWDAAFILAEHLIYTPAEWASANSDMCTTPATKRVVELGAGTGLCGMLIAKSVPCHVDITDLPELLPLMQQNVALNFGNGSEPALDDVCWAALLGHETHSSHQARSAKGTVTPRVLRWGVKEDYAAAGGPYDVVLGADVVASLYDPVALAHTIHDLCVSGCASLVFVSYKGRLTGPHRTFEATLGKLFVTVERFRPTLSRNRNPDVWILKAIGKKDDAWNDEL